MWSRDTWLEPEVAKSTLDAVSHAVEVSLTHFFAHCGVILLPSACKCESMPLLQAPKRLATQERVISGVIFPIVDSPGDCLSVMLSESIGSKVVGGAHKWDDRLLKLRENATAIVEPLCRALNLPGWQDPSFIFDMQGAAVQAMAAHAAGERSSATVLSVHLNGLDPGEWADIFAIIDPAHLAGRRELRRAA